MTVADPAGGHADAAPAAWAATFAACAAVCALCRRGAVALGCATGVLFGLSAALTKVVVGRLDEGVVHALLDWHVLALVVVGAAALDRSQASLRAGSLGTALAAQMAFDALTSLLIGVLAFGERLHTNPLALAAALAGLALALAGLAALAAESRRVRPTARGAAPTRPAAAVPSGITAPLARPRPRRRRGLLRHRRGRDRRARERRGRRPRARLAPADERAWPRKGPCRSCRSGSRRPSRRSPINRLGAAAWWRAALAGHIGSALIAYALIGLAGAEQAARRPTTASRACSARASGRC